MLFTAGAPARASIVSHFTTLPTRSMYNSSSTSITEAKRSEALEEKGRRAGKVSEWRLFEPPPPLRPAFMRSVGARASKRDDEFLDNDLAYEYALFYRAL